MPKHWARLGGRLEIFFPLQVALGGTVCSWVNSGRDLSEGWSLILAPRLLARFGSPFRLRQPLQGPVGGRRGR